MRQNIIHLLKQALDIVERYNNLHKTTGTEFSGTLAIRQALTNIEEIAPPMAAPMLEIRLGGLSSGCCFPMTVESTAPSSTWLESHGEETVV